MNLTNAHPHSLTAYLDDDQLAALDDDTIALAIPHAAMLETAMTALHRLLPYATLRYLLDAQFDNTTDTANDPDFIDDDYPTPTPPMPPMIPDDLP